MAADVGSSQRYTLKKKGKKKKGREKQNAKKEAKKKTNATKHSGRDLRSSAMEGRERRRTKEARESLRHGVARTLHISRDAAEADDRNLRLFKQWGELSMQDKRRLTGALQAAPRYEMVELDESDDEDLGVGENAQAQRIELAALRRADRSVSQENFRRLDGETWLDETVIDMFTQAYVNDSCTSAHCMRAHFMAKLMEDNVGNDDYAAEESAKKNFEEVRAWCGNLETSALGVMFVPINVDRTHWIFLRVDLSERKISLYDSMGSVDPRNRKFMAAMRRYLYDANFDDEDEDSRADFDSWKLGWAIQDCSRHAPKQRNTTDCGVFTLLSIYLASRGVDLRRSSYTQEAVYDLRMRRSIALALMKANDLPPAGSVAHYFTRVSMTQPGACASRSTRSRKRRRVESRVAVGSSKVRDDTSPRRESTVEEGRMNRKRTAKSLADSRKGK